MVNCTSRIGLKGPFKHRRQSADVRSPGLLRREIFAEKRVAEGILADIISCMNTSFIACSVMSAGIGLGTLLLRRQAH